MAIQMRRGPLAQYNKSKMLAGEWGISVDNDTNDQKAFIAFAPGVDKEVMFVEDAQAQIAVATAEAISDATEKAEALVHGNSYHVNDYASGDGSTTAFTLSETPSAVLGVYVDGTEVSNYSVSGTTLTFATAPASGSDNIRVYYTVSTSTDNALYYKNQASSSASSASGSASSASGSATLAQSYAKGNTGTRTGEATDNAEYYKTQAGNSATAAVGSATAAATSEDQAEAWADGEINGTPVGSSAPQYHNNAKYWSDQAAASAATLDAPKILGDFASYEATTTASKAYKVGELLTYNGYLYRVTTAIALGGTITVGTNVVQTTVGDEVQNDTLFFTNVSISAASTAADIGTVSDGRITADHILVECVWDSPSSITSDITWTTSAGSLALNGTCSAATTATVTLVKKKN